MSTACNIKPIFRFGFSNAVKADRFPEKLYDVVEDNYIIRWTRDGKGIVVDENGFSDIIMDCYPGFLQIPDFPNFRRLFREYSFDWEQRGSIFEFSHPYFIRGKPELLSNVLTRRRSCYKTKLKYTASNVDNDETNDLDDFIDYDTPGRRTRRGFIPLQKPEKKKRPSSPQVEVTFDEKTAYKIHERPSLTKPIDKKYMQSEPEVMQDEQEDERLQKGSLEENKKAIENIINVFAINELSPEEFLEYLQRKRTSLISPEQENSSPIHIEFPSMKSKDKSLIDIPPSPNYQIDDFAFTQIRAAAVSSPIVTDDYFKMAYDNQYHTMENFGASVILNDNIARFPLSGGGMGEGLYTNAEPMSCQCNCHKR